MKTPKRTLRILTVAATAATVLVTTAPAGAAPGQWTVSPTPTVSGQDLYLNAVDIPAPGEVWAVGYRFGTVGGAFEFRTVVLHSSGGSTFQFSPSRDREGAPATNFLQGVSGTSANDIWAAGWSRDPGQPSRTLIEHWNGSDWTFAASPDPGVHGNILDGIDALAPSDVWAVGARTDDFYQAPLAEHWNGSAWAAVRSPNPSFCTGHSYLTDVTMVATDDVWAVGWCTASSRGGEQGYVLRWNGSRWSIPPRAVAAIPPNTELYGVSAAGTRSLWLAGFSRDTGAVVVKRVGHTWTSLPLNRPDVTLAGIVARGATSAFGVGTAPSPQPPFAGPGVLRLTKQAPPTTEPIPVDFGSLRGVAYDASSGLLWSVGTQLPGSRNTPLVVSRPA